MRTDPDRMAHRRLPCPRHEPSISDTVPASKSPRPPTSTQRAGPRTLSSTKFHPASVTCCPPARVATAVKRHNGTHASPSNPLLQISMCARVAAAALFFCTSPTKTIQLRRSHLRRDGLAVTSGRCVGNQPWRIHVRRSASAYPKVFDPVEHPLSAAEIPKWRLPAPLCQRRGIDLFLILISLLSGLTGREMVLREMKFVAEKTSGGHLHPGRGGLSRRWGGQGAPALRRKRRCWEWFAMRGSDGGFAGAG